ncbi:MAG: hypothetical protein WAO69_18330 [Aestuariivita sp.]|uniref:hypothetical protein n=1 Tax=Aestuariivita sp. TaxID=1872407 RepID=UPI003BAE54CE
MVEDDSMQVLSHFASAYLNPQAYDVEALKDFFEEEHNAEQAKLFQYQLSETIGEDGMDQEAWEELTDDEFDDGDEWLDYLTAVYAYLFEDGPYPIDDDA